MRRELTAKTTWPRPLTEHEREFDEQRRTKTMTTETSTLFNGRHIKPMGGNLWCCTDCDGAIVAECECCEPPRCNCQRAATSDDN